MSVIEINEADAPDLSPGRPAGDEVRRSVNATRLLDPLLVASMAAGISAAGAARPSLWYDEAATISASSSRPLSQLWPLLGHIDSVHGLYYLLMHGWFAVFPPTEFWSRAPSCLAVGVAAAGTVVLAKQLSTRSVARCAGIVFAVLPRTTWAGIEARSYAFTAMAAVWLTVLLIAAVRRNKAALWLLYAVALAISTLLNIYLILLIPMHAAVLAVLPSRRFGVLWWATTSALAVAFVIPLLLLSRTQTLQISWISPLSRRTFGEILQEQYFDHSLPFAILVGFTFAASIALWLCGACNREHGIRQLVVIAIAWITIPTVASVIYSAFAFPIYYPRYLTFTSPAMALLLGACIVAVARSPLGIASVLAALTVAAAPNFIYVQRGPYAKEGMDFSQIADVVTYHAAPGDCLVLDNTTSWKPGPIRPLLAARPSAYRKLVDPGRGAPATSTNRLWDGFVPIWAVRDRVRACTVLWTVSERDDSLADHDSGPSLSPGPRLGGAPVFKIPQQMGFRLVERWQFSFAQITKAIRQAQH
ncbi:MAG: putative rane protein [Mycobacterium sp.]|nr:putative rane protein [Mycobacterium sp.]